MSPKPVSGLKILMLHGYTQSGSLFHAKTRALEKALIKAFPSSTLHYPTGPLPLRPADIPGFIPSEAAGDAGAEEIDSFGWWRRQDGSPVYGGIDRGLEKVAETIRKEGAFDGVIGFSQGGAVAAMVASLLEPGRQSSMNALHTKDSQKFPFPVTFMGEDGEVIQKPLKFALIYSGFSAPLELYSGFYEPKISTPMLHFLGSLDTVVDEKRGLQLIHACEDDTCKIVTHPGGHFLPSQKIWLEAAVGFIRQSLGEVDEKKDKKEHSVEDMDVPF